MVPDAPRPDEGAVRRLTWSAPLSVQIESALGSKSDVMGYVPTTDWFDDGTDELDDAARAVA